MASLKGAHIGQGLLCAAVLYVLWMLVKNLSEKGRGSETMAGRSNAASGNAKMAPMGITGAMGGVQPSDPRGQNETFASATGVTTNTHGMPSSTGCKGSTNPADLMPADNGGAWAQLNPTGSGILGNINTYSATYLMGQDTIGTSFKNPNLQLRSEPPNPIAPISIWNQSSITHDQVRPSFEIGSGAP